MKNQLREKLRNDPEKRRRLYPALIPWMRPRSVLYELNTWSPKDWDWYWYRGWGWTDDIPEEHVIRILEEEDLVI